MNKKLISIIIPVYNGEKHIKMCINNILKQTYSNIEIIVLNDGSNDKTKEILDNLNISDKRLKIVHKENTGVSDTRNLGINISQGEYIIFLDSDDYLTENAIENMMKLINNKDFDMLIYGFKVKGSKNRFNDSKTLRKLYEIEYKKDDILKAVISTKDNIFGYVWRALYSKDLLISNDIKFPKEIKISEDYMFFVNSINCSENIVIDCNEYYLYNINEQSMSIKYIPSLLNDMMFVNEWMFDNLLKEKPSLLVGYNCSVSNTYLRSVQNLVRNHNFSLSQCIKISKKIKKEKNFKKYINKVWFRFNCFTLKSFISIFMFKLNLDTIYIILFFIKERMYQK